ncbi:MAG: magnesium-translocating P-type ATPase [Clostridiaceae bacterium]|nr:magnesium-translocating P-type ATPase [Clostridiaceae bacterium]
MKELLRTHPKLHQTFLNDNLEKDYQVVAGKNAAELLAGYHTDRQGLSQEQAAALLNANGKNLTTDQHKIRWYTFLLKSFWDEFIIVLILLAIVSLFLQDTLGAMIIFILACISVGIRFTQNYSAYRQSEKLKTMLHSTVFVRRDHEAVKINIEDIVVGDLVELNVGSLIPADLRLLEAKDFYISQSMFTGESIPVEKRAEAADTTLSSTELANICLMGSNVVSGSGLGVIVKTGKATYLGHISRIAQQNKGKTNFEKGLSQVTNTLVKYMIFIVLGVFIINGLVKKDWLAAFMFSISVAVGITPGMLPMIVNSTLSKGAIFLARKKTLVKNINAIQNLGAIDILCTDKTGTLTMDNIVLQRYLNTRGEYDLNVLDYAYMNSYFSEGIKNLIDRAILAYGAEKNTKADVDKYTKIDEIPFDYNRRKMSVVVRDSDGHFRIITKGAIEDILKVCTTVKDGDSIQQITAEITERINLHADELSQDGLHVIAIAEKTEYAGEENFSVKDENEMTFIGYVAFLDPPKPGVNEAIKALNDAGVAVKVLTGDSPVVAAYICKKVGLDVSAPVLTGNDIEAMNDAELKSAVLEHTVFARLAPMQKERVVKALRSENHVVGYLGDGVNDAPSLRIADVGISVDTATDIAKESSDIILLEKDLMILKDGIFEGRKIYGNIMKYMKMALSSNFGNVFSVLVASIFLPFLPMLPIQILIQNLIYDMSQIAIPWDRVDAEFIEKPRQWNIHGLTRFMNTMGGVSSIYDMLTFISLWFILKYNNPSSQSFFQTGWFIEGLISQCLIVHFIRTSKVAFLQSRADIRLLLTTGISIAFALLNPIIFHQVTEFHFEIMPGAYYLFLALILAAYVVTIEIVKRIYIKINGEWL